MSELERLFYTARGAYRRLKIALLAARQRAQRAEARAAAHFAEARQVYERLDARAAIYEQCDRDKQAEIDALRARLERAERERDSYARSDFERQLSEARAELAELQERYERDTIGGGNIAKLTEQLAEACHARDTAIAAVDQLTASITLKSPVTSYEATLERVMRERYGREARQWKANHDQRKAERDAAREDAADMRAVAEELQATLTADRDADALYQLRQQIDDLRFVAMLGLAAIGPEHTRWIRVLCLNLYTGAQLCRSYGLGFVACLAPDHGAAWRPGCGRELP